MGFKRGDIYFVAEKVGTVGSEQQGNRPAIILSSQKGVNSSRVLSCIYLTTANKKKLSVHVDINSTKEKSIALCEQIVPVDKSRIRNKMGELTEEELEQVEKAVIVSLGLSLEERSKNTCKLLDENSELFTRANNYIRSLLAIGHEIERLNFILSNVYKINIGTGLNYLDVYIPNELKNHIKEDIKDFLIEKRNSLEDKLKLMLDSKEVKNESVYVNYLCSTKENVKEELNEVRTLNEKAIPYIREYYTEGTKSLKDIANELGTDKKTLYEFITFHGLKRIE